jgi:hypothetical protein
MIKDVCFGMCMAAFFAGCASQSTVAHINIAAVQNEQKRFVAQQPSPLMKGFDESFGEYQSTSVNARQSLMLLQSGGYSFKYYGCEGLYGGAVGTWHVKENSLILDPISEEGDWKLRRLEIIFDDMGKPLLILPQLREDVAAFVPVRWH